MLEGDMTSYRLSVIRGRKGRSGLPAGIRDVYILNRAEEESSEDQDVGVEEVETEEQPEVEKQPETPVEEIVEEAPEEVPEEQPEETPPTEAPLDEVAPVEEEIVEEEPIEEPPVEVTEEPEPEQEQEPEPEVVEEEKPTQPSKPYMTLSPESPVFIRTEQSVDGTIYGLPPRDTIYLMVEKSTSGENGWSHWKDVDLVFDPNSERTSASH